MTVFSRALSRLRIALPAAALAAGLLTAATLGAAKPDPTLTGASANSQMIGTFCAVDVDVDWIDVKGPGSVTLELTGSGNPTSATYAANDGGVVTRLWPGSGEFDEIHVVVTKKNGSVLIDASETVSVSC
jgi:hypothetical protein